MSEPAARTIATTTHGRYLVAGPATAPAGLLVGFHGYAETAAVHLEALGAIRGTNRWVVVAVQGLHRFYTRDQRVVASWMTSEDRELAIADNLDYARRVVADVATGGGVRHPLVFVGFSQGGAMAYRAASSLGADGLIVLAADLPPDVASLPDLTLPPVLIGRGTADTWYTADKHGADVQTLERRGVPVRSCVFEGGHEWGATFCEEAARYLESRASS